MNAPDTFLTTTIAKELTYPFESRVAERVQRRHPANASEVVALLPCPHALPLLRDAPGAAMTDINEVTPLIWPDVPRICFAPGEPWEQNACVGWVQS
jgi:hypothetical protein